MTVSRTVPTTAPTTGGGPAALVDALRTRVDGEIRFDAETDMALLRDAGEA